MSELAPLLTFCHHLVSPLSTWLAVKSAPPRARVASLRRRLHLSPPPASLWPELSSSSDLPSTRLEDFGGDLRPWNAAWEQEIADTYNDQTKPFITGVRFVETRVCSVHLDVLGHAVRAKGRRGLALQESILSYIAQESDFEENYVRKWEEASVERREEVVLKALHRAAKEGGEETRILAPELVLRGLTESLQRRRTRNLQRTLV